MKLGSQRIDLVPLNAAELLLATENYAELQQQLGLNALSAELDDDMQYAMKIRLKKVQQDPEQYLWLTNWAIIHQKDQCIIGFIILKGYPNEKGEVIIGYVIDEKYRRKGYATEALMTINTWIFSHPHAIYVIADTEKDNIASHKVLERLGSKRYLETEDLIWWRITKELS
ncbi:GNAT family N-acetyltransferase [Paenibacillus sp. FSL R10-2734]|uniref:GNAT family N-acetyltransferase n=1 Tax=Paenibacillus sp. FSL R10-2734 TaxID=2954691 RepID=UPI0030DA05D9